MKKTNLAIAGISLLTLISANSLRAADVGTVNLSLPVNLTSGSSKLVGVFLARPVLAKGELNTAVTNGATSFDAYGTGFFSSYTAASESGTAEYAPTSDNHFVVEFTSGPYTGLIKQISAFSGSTATVKGALPALDSGTRFVLRKDHTLASLFGDGALISLQAGTSTANSDVISVMDSQGVLKRYFYESGRGWRSESNRGASGANRANVRVSLGTGFAIAPKATKTIYLGGEYRGTRSRISIPSTAAIVANPYPVAVSLNNSGLANYLTKASSAANADSIRFLESGRYVPYHHTGTVFVRSVNGGSADVGSSKTLGQGDAFLIVPMAEKDVAFAPQYLTK
jgi:hypothetical protein